MWKGCFLFLLEMKMNECYVFCCKKCTYSLGQRVLQLSLSFLWQSCQQCHKAVFLMDVTRLTLSAERKIAVLMDSMRWGFACRSGDLQNRMVGSCKHLDDCDPTSRVKIYKDGKPFKTISAKIKQQYNRLLNLSFPSYSKCWFNLLLKGECK